MTVKLRSRSPSCVACGNHPTISASSLPSYDYMCFTGQEAQDGPPTPLTLLPEQHRLQPRQAKVRPGLRGEQCCCACMFLGH